MGIHEKLLNIQCELKAPKNQRNNFGGYNYRSCEDILEAVKPLLKANNCALTISDELVYIGERYYIKATAILTDTEATPDGFTTCVTNTAYAREPAEKKGADLSQITGACSSYARKYALNGLFCIDDVKDADSTNDHGKAGVKAGAKQLEIVKSLVTDVDAMLKYYKVAKIEDLTVEQANEVITKFSKKGK